MLVGTGSKRRLVKLQPIHQALDWESGSWSDRIPCFYRLGYHWTDSWQRQANVLETIQKGKRGHPQSICTVETDAGPFQWGCSRSRGVYLLTFRTKGQHQGPGTTALEFVQKEQGRGGETSPHKSSTKGIHSKSPLPGNDLVACRHSKTKFAITHQHPPTMDGMKKTASTCRRCLICHQLLLLLLSW